MAIDPSVLLLINAFAFILSLGTAISMGVHPYVVSEFSRAQCCDAPSPWRSSKLVRENSTLVCEYTTKQNTTYGDPGKPHVAGYFKPFQVSVIVFFFFTFVTPWHRLPWTENYILSTPYMCFYLQLCVAYFVFTLIVVFNFCSSAECDMSPTETFAKVAPWEFAIMMMTIGIPVGGVVLWLLGMLGWAMYHVWCVQTSTREQLMLTSTRETLRMDDRDTRELSPIHSETPPPPYTSTLKELLFEGVSMTSTI